MSGTELRCSVSGLPFRLEEKEISFRERGGYPLPQLSPIERARRRQGFRNERALHRRTCDKTGAEIISIYRPDCEHTIYSIAAWWEDSWDATVYGQDFDFSRPFFEQFDQVFRRTPLPAAKIMNCENCDYNHAVVNSKNAYRCARLASCQDVYYSHLALNSRNCVDCFFVYSSELCYECIRCTNCYDCQHCELAENCFGLVACYDCRGCKECIGCVSLRNKEHYIFNQKVSKDEYRQLRESLKDNRRAWQDLLERFIELKLHTPRRALELVNCENVLGDYLVNSRNCRHCYESADAEDCLYGRGIHSSKDCLDSDLPYLSEKMFECLAPMQGYNCCAAVDLIGGSDLFYTFSCVSNCKSLFGCVGLKKKEYCILNKQYSPDQYQALVARIIAHMKATGEWGEFFPAQISPFPFNDSVAQLYYPLSQAEATQRGLWWVEDNHETPKADGDKILNTVQAAALTVDQLKSKILLCERTGRPFKLIGQEMHFYKEAGLPPPLVHPDQRHLLRAEHINPFRLHERACAVSGAPILTTYPPESPYTIISNDLFKEKFDQ